MNPNMVGTSVEVVVNMANHSPYNGITCHGKMTETKSMKQSHGKLFSVFILLAQRVILHGE